ncbi:MAG TPA: response regulator [Desulfobulbus sp.]|nr:response regulator [Desulfobulbus sp.]
MEKNGMYNFLLVSPRAEELADFTATLAAQPDITLKQVDTGREMLKFIQEKSPHLVILDQEIKDGDSLELVNEILRINAMINTTMITYMDAASWHEKSEGLGMMPPVPNPPAAEDAIALLNNFRAMPGLS